MKKQLEIKELKNMLKYHRTRHEKHCDGMKSFCDICVYSINGGNCFDTYVDHLSEDELKIKK